MNKKLLFISVLGIALACGAQGILQQANDIKIVNNDNQVKISALANSQTLPWVEFGTQTNVVFHVHSDGSIYMAATTNQITFGATNASPLSATVAAYVSVRVDGDTNIYRMPLYK